MLALERHGETVLLSTSETNGSRLEYVCAGVAGYNDFDYGRRNGEHGI